MLFSLFGVSQFFIFILEYPNFIMYINETPRRRSPQQFEIQHGGQCTGRTPYLASTPALSLSIRPPEKKGGRICVLSRASYFAPGLPNISFYFGLGLQIYK